MENRIQTDPQAARIRLVARIVRDVLRGETFEDLGSLREAVKCAAARYHIPGYVHLVDEALRLVGSNQPLVRTPRPAAAVVRPGDPAPLARQDAAVLFTELRRRFPKIALGRPMPKARPRVGRDADRFRALQIVSQAIVDVGTRVAALEAAVERGEA